MNEINTPKCVTNDTYLLQAGENSEIGGEEKGQDGIGGENRLILRKFRYFTKSPK